MSMNTNTFRRGRLYQSLHAVAGTAIVLAAGCSNPFGPEEFDYARHLEPARVRQIDPGVIDRFRKPKAEQSAEPPPADIARKRFDGLQKLDLALEACRASALTNNLDLKVALLNPTIAQQSVSAEEGRFESVFTTRALWRQTDAPTSSELEGSQVKDQFIEPGVRIPLRTGETISVGLPIDRTETNNQFSTLNPAYSSDLAFSISQPLLRGAGRRANTAPIKIASYNEQAVEAQTKLEVIRQIANVDRTYWRLYQARQELDVRQQQYELANAQLQRARRRVEAGSSAEIEITRAESGLADRLESIIIVQNVVLQAQRELKRVMNMPGLTVDTTTLIVPTTLPDPVEYVFEPSRIADFAIANRMEMLELELRIAADTVRVDLARNSALPLFTLDYSYRINGLGSSGQDSFRQLEGNNYEDWSVGFNAEIPLGNEQAMSEVRRSILERLQRLGTKDAREQAIRQETLDAIDGIEQGWQRILAARQAVILNARTLQGEQRQFDVGARTSTDVLDAAANLADAQSAEIRALTDYQIAQVNLAFATGLLLGAEKIRFEPGAAPDASLDIYDYIRADPPEGQRKDDSSAAALETPPQEMPVNTPEAEAEKLAEPPGGEPVPAPGHSPEEPPK